MAIYNHKEFMKKKGKAALEARGYTIREDLIVYSIPATKAAQKKAAQQKVPPKKYTKWQLFGMRTNEQEKILKEYGITTAAKIERDRVAQILEAQDGSNTA